MTDSSDTATTTPSEADSVVDSRSSSADDRPSGTLDHSSIPRMGAEIGYQVVSEDEIPPLRASGIVCLILGLLSFWALVAWQMVIIPIVAIICGIIALRRWGKVRPAGTSAAVIGLVLASGFGAAGIMIPYLKHRTLGYQAQYFAREFLEIIGDGQVELAIELQKPFQNRQMKEMNLEQAYSDDEVARQQLEEAGNGLVDTVQQAGPDIQWQLAQPVRVFVKYGTEKVDTYWIDPSGKIDQKIQILLEWHPQEETKTGQWHVALFQFHRELIVAPSIL